MYLNEINLKGKGIRQYGTIIWESGSHILKIQDWFCSGKRHGLHEEGNIIGELNKSGHRDIMLFSLEIQLWVRAV